MKKNGVWTLRIAAVFGAAFLAVGCAGAPSELDENVEESDPVAEPEPVAETSEALTVAGAVTSGCSTSSVQGLSLQIIAEGNCISPGAYAAVPSMANLAVSSGVFRYLESPARDRLVNALNAYPGTTLTLTSMLRTVAQQYLLYRWYQTGTCGIDLAAVPGNSNHETGLAMDVSNYSSWTGKLPSYGFQWYGSGDAVHFDYVGTGAVSHKGLDVKAFQRLWNRNHSTDLITADGIWGPQTEARMKLAPATGFPIGACSALIAGPVASTQDISIEKSAMVQGVNEAFVEQNGHEEAIEQSCGEADIIAVEGLIVHELNSPAELESFSQQ